MKIAVFHNFLDNIGGAEFVSLIMARELDADIYTTNIDREKISKMGFKDVLPRIFSIGAVPLNPPFKQQIASLRFRLLTLDRKYDFYIISGDWAISGAVKNKPNLWYVHSPIREIWDLYKHTRENIVAWYKRPLFDLWVLYNRYLNKIYIKKVDTIICNSNNTKGRLKLFLDREAVVINPPTDTSKFFFKDSGNYWLSVNRLIAHKRIDLQMKAFEKLPEEKLIIVGSYEQSSHFKKYAKYCKKIKPDNVEIRSWVDNKELIDLYAGCKGLIATSKDEDFGLNVIEAMASGKPVIAPNEGGYKETIINGKTGILIDDIDENKLIKAIDKINKDSVKYKNDCLNQAKKFDTSVFIKKIKEEIIKQKNGRRHDKLSSI